MPQAEYSIAVTTTDSEALASLIAADLVERRLAACVQVDAIRSFYRWDGEVRDEPENRLTIKCRTADFAEVERRITELHTYDLPEVVRMPIDGASAAYLGWLESETSRPR
ncbi:MAG: divalent-cation tolerance protein CutA [Microthrixaceae bacterium]